MASKKKRGQTAAVDMTPMIDCVFLLIIFFVVSTQIVTDVVPLEPPFAINASEEKLGDEKTIINVNHLGVHVGGKACSTWDEFKEKLEARAKSFDTEEDGFSKMFLYIRGDTVGKWKYVQEVLAIANETEPQIYKTDFGVQLDSSSN